MEDNQGLKRFNPLDEVAKMGRLSAIPDSVPDKDDMQTVVRYEVYNVNDVAEKQLLCDIKSLIVAKGYPFKEETTFNKEGEWIVALNWHEDARPGS
jgi:hypothetical protein